MDYKADRMQAQFVFIIRTRSRPAACGESVQLKPATV